MSELGELIPFFTGIDTWIALAGAALFVFLVLFKKLATEFAVAMKVPRHRAALIVHMFMILVAVITLTVLVLAFLDARDDRATEARQAAAERYEKQLVERQSQVDQCVSDSVAKANFSQPFTSKEQGVRCPGGGCPLKPGSCNRREGMLSYSAPGDYFIESYQLKRGHMNHGDVNGLKVNQRDGENRAIAVEAIIWCDPPDFIGAAGGWANASVEGVIRLRNENTVRENLISSCENRYPEPVPPK